MLGCVSPHSPCITVSNFELRWTYTASRDDLLLPSATSLGTVFRRENALTVDAIKKQLPSRNEVCLALTVLTSPNKLAITLVIAHYMDRNLALREVHLACDEVGRLFLSRFES